ncbi:Tellurite resistance protein or related permease [Halapricum desulfuricans]|uniref:Tellurite resistance protein or related permease n=1 Tax=Halapricum desulfuricans TaxID=2841257 RepID=A0A897NJU7_9EURY|nr:C4-dicarboxylate transporter [Halapricum desulfuricans]QSG12928.1 Tellurite resistance protein or related permease [Halapricum desulfuricans]
MSQVTSTSTRARVANTVEFFGPQWFGSTMGTGALGVALGLLAAQSGIDALLPFAQLFVALTAAMTVTYTLPWLARMWLYPHRVWNDLTHPIRSQFFPTMPITLIVLGLGIARTMGDIVPSSVLEPLLTGLFVLGSAGIFGFGLVVVTIMFTNDEIGTEHGVFAWYIPPVSHLVIPLLGFELVAGHLAGTATGQLVFVVSMIALGIGTFMFLFFGSIVLHRYAYESLPREKLAPTFVIGLAPTAVLTIALVKLAHALEAGVGLGLAVEPLVPGLKLLALVMWGFSAWWFVLTAGLVAHYVTRRTHPFFFTWWAYTFPLGAFAISAGSLGGFLGISAFTAALAAVTGLLAVVWVVTAALTTRMVLRGHAFTPE